MLGVQHKIGGKLEIVHHANSDSIQLSDTGKIHTNGGSTGMITLTLPENAPTGIEYTFCLVKHTEVRILPVSSKILLDNNTQDDHYYSCLYLGGLIGICADENGDWIVIERGGTWTIEP